jgi:hypothetical protein
MVLLHYSLVGKEKISRKEFINLCVYHIPHLGGHPSVAELIFDGLASHEGNAETKDDTIPVRANVARQLFIFTILYFIYGQRYMHFHLPSHPLPCRSSWWRNTIRSWSLAGPSPTRARSGGR